MKLIKTTEAAGHILCHDLTRIVKGVSKGPAFRKGHIVTDNNGVAVGEWQTTTQIGYDASKFNVHIFHGQFETVN